MAVTRWRRAGWWAVKWLAIDENRDGGRLSGAIDGRREGGQLSCGYWREAGRWWGVSQWLLAQGRMVVGKAMVGAREGWREKDGHRQLIRVVCDS